MGTPDFRDVPTRVVEEAKEVVGRGYGGAYGADLIGVWYTADYGLFVPVLGTNVVFH